ncbi:MAG TPA: multiheme c-type cytochrome [Hyphomicrobium sp.]|nr:multiheme c-type cytochrome [Hyphomicrobium sp.]
MRLTAPSVLMGAIGVLAVLPFLLAGIFETVATRAEEPRRALSMPEAHPRFVGSDKCAGCHSKEHAEWRSSQHKAAMQQASDQTVLGDFANSTFVDANVTTTFFRRDGKFWVRTDGPDGKLAEFEIRYTFGVFPLQQYLIALPKGHWQAFGIAWDSRPKAAGGQRWFSLNADRKPVAGSPMHWTGIDQNWNYQCAWCHSRTFKKIIIVTRTRSIPLGRR